MSAVLAYTASAVHAYFNRRAAFGRIGRRVALEVNERWGEEPKDSEIQSWNNSLPILAADLESAGLGHLTMFIEFWLPYSNRRADVILAGPDRDNGEPRYTLVELKQWTKPTVEGDPSAEDDERSIKVGGYVSPHPRSQARGYHRYLQNFMVTLADAPFDMLVYAHNLEPGGVKVLTGDTKNSDCPIFGRKDREELLQHLLERYGPGSSIAAAQRLKDCRPGPTPEFMAKTKEVLNARSEWVLIDEQRRALAKVVRAIENAEASDTKTAVIVSGGPGSGKTAIALSVLAHYFDREDHPKACYATWSSAFRESLKMKACKGDRAAQELFLSPRTLDKMDANHRNSLVALICDEAHRLERNTSLPKQPKHSRPQIDEIFEQARVPVFLLDENQCVRASEIGTAEQIAKSARTQGYKVESVDLDLHFRSGGSASYQQWVTRLLGLSDGGPVKWSRDQRYDLRVASSPEALESFLRSKPDYRHRTRITAGYCWKWSYPVDGRLLREVKIGEWSMPWNAKGKGDSAPKKDRWALWEGGFEQVGCVFTAQGFEFDWTGVILGRDLIYRDGRIKVDASRNLDRGIRGKDQAFTPERLIRNIYNVLLTRGLQGTVIFAVDEPLQRFLTDLVSGLDPKSGPVALQANSGRLDYRVNHWRASYELVDDARSRELAELLYKAGVPEPEIGVERADGYISDLAWPKAMIAVLPEIDDRQLMNEAIEAYRAQGWVARPSAEWTVEELVRALGT